LVEFLAIACEVDSRFLIWRGRCESQEFLDDEPAVNFPNELTVGFSRRAFFDGFMSQVTAFADGAADACQGRSSKLKAQIAVDGKEPSCLE
jgi:hypothetical protein